MATHIMSSEEIVDLEHPDFQTLPAPPPDLVSSPSAATSVEPEAAQHQPSLQSLANELSQSWKSGKRSIS